VLVLLILLMAVWCGFSVGIGRLAVQRGRSVVAWVVVAGICGVAGALGWVALIERAMSNRDPFGGDLAMFAVVTPILCMAVPMGGIALVLLRLPVHVARRERWPVHFVGHGAGTVADTGAVLAFTWPDGALQLRRGELSAVADGECVRVAAPGTPELVMIPTGTPGTRAGRIRQSEQLAAWLGIVGHGDLPSARVVRR
jgi:hypothetical protein